MKTDVIFRKWKDGDIVALFPYEIESGLNFCLSYEHNGQHGRASLDIIKVTKPAGIAESEFLKKELESLGYDLNVVKRVRYHKRAAAELQKLKEALK